MSYKFILLPFFLLMQATLFAQSNDESQISKPVLNILRLMAESNTFHNSAIGIAGIKSDQYKRFERLLKIASTTELEMLIHHDSPAVKAYSFWALAKQYHKDLGKYYDMLKNDSGELMTMNGCIAGNALVSDAANWIITRDVWDSECKKLR